MVVVEGSLRRLKRRPNLRRVSGGSGGSLGKTGESLVFKIMGNAKNFERAAKFVNIISYMAMSKGLCLLLD